MDSEWQVYCDFLADKIVKMFGVSREKAVNAVKHSSIQELIKESPIFVDHTPLYCWAEYVYEEMLV